MPEGDTIHRTARTLRGVLAGRDVVGVDTRLPQLRDLGLQRLVGQRVAAVESRGKHLLVWFAPGDLALHTHLGMRGSWHVYADGQTWRKPASSARFSVAVAGWTAVCFAAPVVELLSRVQVDRHPSLASLGPDALAEHTDLAEARRRLDARPGHSIGEALLDQRVLAGVGNVYRCEVLFLHGLDPWTPVRDVPPRLRDELLATAQRLLKANVGTGAPSRRTTTGRAGGQRLHVYGRARRPCPVCATPVRAGLLGEQTRVVYWCPCCQARGPAPA